VQILRQRRAQFGAPGYRPWAALAVVLTTGALLLAAGFRSAAPLSAHDPSWALVPCLIALLIAFCAGPQLLARLRPLWRTRPGESLDALLEQLPNDYYLINDLPLRAARVDHVLAGPCGIVVIAIRRVAGHVQCEGNRWWLNGRPCKSYSQPAKAGAIAVRKFLAAKHPEFRREIVRTIVVFTNRRSELHLREPEVAVVRGADLLASIVELGLGRKMDRGLAHVAAHRLAGGGPARFSSGRPSPRTDRAR
jgi:hypothetical protein